MRGVSVRSCARPLRAPVRSRAGNLLIQKQRFVPELIQVPNYKPSMPMTVASLPTIDVGLLTGAQCISGPKCTCPSMKIPCVIM
eukprot:CAMPEP_0180155702 /NCGR_PEP_ID=MMETSP0986-20121125/25035_1 /TAXON_ID=697907 /ORGANISM="non described non described, Strain CCMP2293" /LENGTH=83 /DNA_ID=CAMNT_0022104545 /DNA_START=34 /DNA_END=285 /DNA_ORIENTATION=-